MVVSSPKGYINGHGYVDLGLSVKWATCNVGASLPKDYGDYFAWGETSIKSYYSWDNYFYKDNMNIGSDIKGTYYDLAYVKWGGSWRMPNKSECEELINRCTWSWAIIGGHRGCKVTGPNGNSIYLPASGCYRYKLDFKGSAGHYWSSTADGVQFAWYLVFSDSKPEISYDVGTFGKSIRPVSE